MIKQFLSDIKDFGLKVALGNQLIVFTKWFIKAKRIQITYFKKHGTK